MKNWKAIAAASGFGIPEAELDRIAPALDALGAAVEPLVAGLPPELDPATVLSAPPEPAR